MPSLAAAVPARPGHDLAAPLAASADGSEAEQSRAAVPAAAPLAIGTILVMAAPGQAAAAAMTAPEQPRHLDDGLHTPDGRGKGYLQIVAEVGAGGLSQGGGATIDTEKFCKDRIPVKARGLAVVLRRGPAGACAAPGFLDGFVGLDYLPEACRGFRIARIVVRVVTPGQIPVAAPDLHPIGLGRNPQYAVVVQGSHNQ